MWKVVEIDGFSKVGNLCKLSWVRGQNNLATVAFDVGLRKLHNFGHRSVDLLRELHWLPVRPESQRVIAASKATNSNCQPTCLCYQNRIHRHVVFAHRRKTCWLFHDQDPNYSVLLLSAAPRVWDGLPDVDRSAPGVGLFRLYLKTCVTFQLRVTKLYVRASAPKWIQAHNKNQPSY